MHPKRDDPVLLDDDDNDDSPVIVRVNEDHRLRRVKNRVNEDNGSSPLSHEGTDYSRSSLAFVPVFLCFAYLLLSTFCRFYRIRSLESIFVFTDRPIDRSIDRLIQLKLKVLF
ncbi:hypothetical protein L6452_14425 [Arctium lappa]|uniref:Uncharacterized protein n=1 Tax=Arctium lappa TaxID=4217 RepID=A0ACB9CL93_ARCLA|nr:hypothetical protein L6452_14425 [Arctium lappa]